MPKLTIEQVGVLELEGTLPPRNGPFQGQVAPIDRYEADRDRRREATEPGPTRARALYLTVTSAEGPQGRYGPIDEAAAFAVLHQLRPVLLGQDALAGATAWDRMQRSDRHGRHGSLKLGISALDNALWDLRGRAFDAPVFQLLGGPSRGSVPAYASTLGRTHARGELETSAKELVEAGFVAQKWFFRHGPSDGVAGLEANVELVARVRGALGPGQEAFFDAFSGWDVRYATAWAREVERYRPGWLEEPLPPSHLAGYEELRRSVQVPLATGEHFYDRFEVLAFLQSRVLSVLQTDPEWCGGVTELVRLCSLAEVFAVPVVPHGHGLHAALHVIASQSPEVCPMAEYLLEVMPRRHWFERRPPEPVGGRFELPKGPGFGIELDEDRVERRSDWRPA